MWSRLLALALLLLPAPALAGVKEDVAALAPSALVLVMDAAGNELVAQNTDKPFVPASVTKIVTAWLAMEVLGGDYRFETRFYLDDKRKLYVRGGGDPFLISEELAPLATELVAAIGNEADHRHRAGRELLPFEPPHPGHREHRRGLQCAELRAGGEFQHCRRRAQRQQGALRRDADPDHPARDHPVPAAGPERKGPHQPEPGPRR